MSTTLPSAPACTRAQIMAASPHVAAKKSGVCWLMSQASTEALAFSSNRGTSGPRAQCSGVRLLTSLASTSARHFNSTWTTAACDRLAAAKSAVRWCLSRESTSQCRSSSRWAHSASWAAKRQVCNWVSASAAPAPAASSCRSTGAHFKPTATKAAVWPCRSRRPAEAPCLSRRPRAPSRQARAAMKSGVSPCSLASSGSQRRPSRSAMHSS
mmetsp:Transcript_77648/g.219596  ORF Transcript_77648/g.219596 Transcript_77648/m.219596 type:complete len:212 (+) Transcript_77648:496-1131(+)